MEVRVINNITKEYPDMIKVIVFKEPRYYVKNDSSKRRGEEVDNDNYVPSISSLNRTKSLIHDITFCNDFELFVTFTFDPDKVDRFNFTACYSKINRWIIHQRDNSHSKGVDFKYLIIPEKHKSGAWHFHGLLSGYTGSLKDSKHLSSSGRKIYNLTSYRSGFTTACKIDDREVVANYVTKYITKDFIKSFNQKRFYCSRNLIRPKRFVNSSVFEFTLPIFRRKIAEDYNSETFLIDKTF